MLLEVDDLRVVFESHEGTIHAVNGVSFAVDEGEAIGIVGESGSGKSVSMLSLLRLLPSPPSRVTGGRAEFAGRDLLRMTAREVRRLNGLEIGVIFQDPRAALNPIMAIGAQLVESLRLHRKLAAAAAHEEAIRLLVLVQLPDPERQMRRYPHELSGGMCQRVLIAIALSGAPRLLIADEPTTALDVTIQAQIVELVRAIRRERAMAVIWITHDLALLTGLVDRVVVMYGGRVVEDAPTEEIFSAAAHPYTRRLHGAAPRLSRPRGERLTTIDGQPPVFRTPPQGCAFAPRCPKAAAKCQTDAPPAFSLTPRHHVACWFPETGVA